MKFGELIEHTVKCIRSFNPVVDTIDSHADNFLAQFKDPYEKVFIKQCFYGCVRYEEFLKTFCKTLFEMRTASTNRNDAPLYSIFAYIAFFRLDELQVADFKKLIQSQEPTKMHVFLQFAFDADNLRENLRQRWMVDYDFGYIDEHVIGGVERHLPAVSDIIRMVEKRATGKVTSTLSMSSSQQVQEANADAFKSQGSVSQSNLNRSQSGIDSINDEDHHVKPNTVPEPFNLTKPKPKMIPVPEVIKREVKANPVPKHLNKKSLADIEKDKEQRRKATVDAIRKEYEGSSKQRFELATGKLPSMAKVDKAKDFVEGQVTKELKFEGTKPRPMPDWSKKQAEVKLTAAALKREKHLIDQEEREEARKLAEMEMGLKDASEFYRWQREMEQKDDIEKMEHVIKKKIEMELSRDQAIAAAENQRAENHALASRVKKQMHEQLEIREQQLEEDLQKRKDVIAQVQSQSHKAADAMQAKRDENRAIRDQVARDMEEAAKRMADEQAAEQARKEELIRQIRELEKIPIQRTKGYDPTEAANHGLMCEMSVAELRERLELNRRKLEQEVDFKREQNLAKKEHEANQLMEDAAKIEDARKRRKTAADLRREQQAEAAKQKELARLAAREKGLKEAFAAISKKKKDKRDEEERLAKELKEIKLQRQYLNANAAMVEYKAWQELEKGKERAVRDQQNEKLLEQCGVNEIMVSDQLVRAKYAKDTVTSKLTYDKGYEERLHTRKKENEVLHKKTLEYKSSMHEKQRAFEENLKETTKKRKPFNAKINEHSMALATAHKARKHQDLDNSMEYIIDHDEMEDSPGAAEMDQASGLDLLGEAEHVQDDIEAKMAGEL